MTARIALVFLVVAAAACGGGDGPDSPRRLVIASDFESPPPADEGFFEGLVRLDLYTLDAESGELLRLTDNETLELGPDCSPDGSRIVFTGGEAEASVEVMNVDGSGRRRVTAGFHPSWSPAGDEIVFARGGSLFAISADGTRERPLLDGEGLDHWPAWAPRGDRIAFLRAPDPDDPHNDLYVVGADGTRERLVLRDVAGGRVSWSPDGSELAVARTVDGSARVWIVDVESGDARKLTPPGRVENPQAQPAWSPDGELIAFQETAGIALVRPDGSGYRRLPLEPTLVFAEGEEIGDWVSWSDPDWCG